MGLRATLRPRCGEGSKFQLTTVLASQELTNVAKLVAIGISLHGSSIDKPPFVGRLVMNCVLIVFELFCCMIYLSQCFALIVTNPS